MVHSVFLFGLFFKVGTIILSMVYFVVIFANEVFSVSKKKQLKGQIMWHKVKRQYLSNILQMAKETDRKNLVVFFCCASCSLDHSFVC